jgi:hypothetical protein
LKLDPALGVFGQVLLEKQNWEALDLLVHCVAHHFLFVWITMVGSCQFLKCGQKMTGNEIFSALQVGQNDLLNKFVSLMQTDINKRG